MTAAAKLLIAIAGATAIAAAVGLVAGRFHLPQTFTSAGVGVAIGVGVALAAFSFSPKRTKCN